MREQLKWYDEKADNSPWIDALAELRQRATREGHCYQHVQAITVAIDQYAEKALGNRDYFLNKPYRRRLGVISWPGVGGGFGSQGGICGRVVSVSSSRGASTSSGFFPLTKTPIKPATTSKAPHDHQPVR